MTKSIDAKDRSVRELLGGVQYSIDFYQRDYKWNTKQCEELMTDLTTRFLDSYQKAHARSEVATYPAYFLGSVVMSKKSDGIFLVDGQQRLTTLTLLLIYLRNLQRASSDNEDPNVESLIVSTQYGRRSFNMNVPERTSAIESLFNGLVPEEGLENQSSDTMIARYRDIEAAFPEQCKGEAMPYFMDWLIERVQMVEISAYSDEDAYTIFETMNDRGLSLSPADMLKGFLLSNIRDPKQREAGESIWKSKIPKLESLGSREPTNDFFRAWLRGRYATTYGKAEDDYEKLGPQFHRWLREKADSLGLKHSDDFFRFVQNDLPVAADRYFELRSAQELFDVERPCEYFVGEGRLDDGLMFMSVVSAEDRPEETMAKMRAVARFLDIFYFRRLWASKNLSKPALKHSYIALARHLRTLDVEHVVARLYAELTRPGHDNFESAPPVLTGSSRRKIHRLLARLTAHVEVSAGSGTNPYPELVVVSGRTRIDLEHIWPRKFEEYRHLFTDEAEFLDYRNRLGSLLLIPYSFNRSYSDMSTDQKLPLYGRSDHHLLVASLARATYERNPKFSRWIAETGFSFIPYDQTGFGRTAAEQRVELYRQLARAIWSPDLLIRNTGLDESVLRRLADEYRGELAPDDDESSGSRREFGVEVIDLIRSGLLRAGDLLTGRQAGTTTSATALVLEDGDIELENGQRFSSVSPAAMALGLGVVINGWGFWIHERSGKSLATLRQEHLQRISGGTLPGMESDDE